MGGSTGRKVGVPGSVIGVKRYQLILPRSRGMSSSFSKGLPTITAESSRLLPKPKKTVGNFLRLRKASIGFLADLPKPVQLQLRLQKTVRLSALFHPQAASTNIPLSEPQKLTRSARDENDALEASQTLGFALPKPAARNNDAKLIDPSQPFCFVLARPAFRNGDSKLLDPSQTFCFVPAKPAARSLPNPTVDQWAPSPSQRWCERSLSFPPISQPGPPPRTQVVACLPASCFEISLQMKHAPQKLTP